MNQVSAGRGRGESEVGFQTISELLPIPGVTIVDTMVAAQVDPTPANRTESQKMVDLIAGVAPDVKAEANTMFTTWSIPPE